MGSTISSFLGQIFYFFGLALVSTVLFIILTQPSIDEFLAIGIPDFQVRYFIKIVLFFGLMYLIDRLMLTWRLLNRFTIQ